MIRWLNPLYLGASVHERAAVIRYRLKFKKFPGLYYYMIVPAGADLPEIIQAVCLKQDYYKKQEFTVIGVAGYKQESLELMAKIIDDTYQHTGTFNVRQYLGL